MRRTSFAGVRCSVARTLEVVGEWWSLLIIRDAFRGVRRFEDFQRRNGIARNVLADRLQTLVDHGVLERRRYQERPERFEYRLTEKGRDLYPVVVTLMEWGDRWAADEAGPPVVLTHRPCGHDIAPVLTCPDCGDPIDPRAMTARDVVALSPDPDRGHEKGRVPAGGRRAPARGAVSVPGADGPSEVRSRTPHGSVTVARRRTPSARRG